MTKKMNEMKDIKLENTSLKQKLVVCNLEKMVKMKHPYLNLKVMMKDLKDENAEWKKESKMVHKCLSSVHIKIQKLKKNGTGMELIINRLERA